MRCVGFAFPRGPCCARPSVGTELTRVVGYQDVITDFAINDKRDTALATRCVGVAVWLWLWLCGCVAVWLCGCVAVWLCGCVAVWLRL